MLYIITALKSEAQAFVDKYKLSKSKLAGFILFSNENIFLIVSGMGILNARLATQTLINQYDITDEDIYLNIGICGASKKYELGSVLEVGSIIYEEISYKFKEDVKEIEEVEEETTKIDEKEEKLQKFLPKFCHSLILLQSKVLSILATVPGLLRTLSSTVICLSLMVYVW